MKLIAQSENIEKFIENNYIYIDKTEYIYNLTKNYERVFFSRPRRFGKSLTLNTIGTLFEKGVDPYFKGTWIYNKWKQDKYPVLHLSFLKFSVTDVVQFKKDFCNEILKFANENNITGFNDSNEPKTLIGNIFSAMPDGCQLVLLIDEYDCQLTANINNKVLYENFRTLFREFYAVLKGEKHIKFMALTGVTRLKDVSIFSVGSDIKDLSYNNAYSKLIGFTRDEIKHFYIDYLKLAASCENGVSESEVTDSQVEEILDKLDYHYNGYCFDKYGEKKVFSTWSVNCFFKRLAAIKKCAYDDYWYDNGGVPTILKEYLSTHNLDIEGLVNKDLLVNVSADEFLNPTSLIDMNRHVLMCQTGYLTLRSPLFRMNSIDLGIPNQEVNRALIPLLALNIFGTKSLNVKVRPEKILLTGSAEEIIELFNTVLNTVSYDHYAITNESILEAILRIYLEGKCNNVSAESMSSKGRTDLLIETGDRRIVIELKYAQNKNEAKVKLDEATAQIKSRDYGNILPLKKETLKIAAVFNADPAVRAFTQFSLV